MIDHVRLAELREEVGEDDFAEVLQLFCEEVEETLDRLAKGVFGDLAEELHFIKGSALNIGMTEVGHLCQKAEKALRVAVGSRPDIAPIVDAFRSAKDAVLSAIPAPALSETLGV